VTAKIKIISGRILKLYVYLKGLKIAKTNFDCTTSDFGLYLFPVVLGSAAKIKDCARKNPAFNQAICENEILLYVFF
jgi:hypothetical protein